MTRDEFKKKINDFIDDLVQEDRELTETDEDNISDQFGDLSTDFFNDDEPESTTQA